MSFNQGKKAGRTLKNVKLTLMHNNAKNHEMQCHFTAIGKLA